MKITNDLIRLCILPLVLSCERPNLRHFGESLPSLYISSCHPFPDEQVGVGAIVGLIEAFSSSK
jgi:hypothetical protein